MEKEREKSCIKNLRKSTQEGKRKRGEGEGRAGREGKCRARKRKRSMKIQPRGFIFLRSERDKCTVKNVERKQKVCVRESKRRRGGRENWRRRGVT